MKNILDILTECRSKGVRIGLDDKDNNIAIKGNISSLSSQDKQNLRDNKESLLNFLRDQKSENISSTFLEDGHKLPLSPNQKSIWLHTCMEENNTMYLIPSVYELEMPSLNKEKLLLAAKALVREHQVLSFIFVEDKGEAFQQSIDFNVSKHIFFEELSHLPSEESRVAYEKAVQRSMQKGFEATEQPPWSITVFYFGDNRYSFFLKIHHLIADGTSLSLIAENLVEAYKAQLTEVPYRNSGIQYHDYLNWVFNRKYQEKSLSFWRSYLNNREDDFQFVFTEGTMEVAESPLIDLKLSSLVSSQVEFFSRKNNIPISHLFSFAFGFVLSKYGRTDDLIMGTPVEGRSRPELGRVIGNLVNTLPLRLRLNYTRSLLENIRSFGQGFLSILEHQLCPLEYILDAINYKRIQGSFPLFNSMVSFPNNQELGIRNKHEFQFKKKKALYNLTLSVLQFQNAIDLQLEFEPSKFTKSFVSNLLDQTLVVLEQMINNPNIPLRDVNLVGLSNNKKKQVLEWSIGAIKERSNEGFCTRWDRVVQSHADAVAVKFDQTEYTYRELDNCVNIFCNFLRESESFRKEKLIGIELDRGISNPVCLIALLKSGKGYLPLDVKLPLDRKAHMKKIAECSFVIDNKCWQAFEQSLPQDKFETVNKPLSRRENELAYIIFTSGSTGAPKGVAISIESMMDYVDTFIDYFDVSSKDIFIQQSSLSFDTHVEEIYPCLLSGGTLLITKNGGSDIEELVDLIHNESATILSTTPLVISELNKTLKGSDELRCIISGGDELRSAQIDELIINYRIFNTYGPSESTVCASYHEIIKLEEVNYIGKPIYNRELYVLDDALNLVPNRQIGELYIGGKGLFQEYINEPVLTSEKLLPTKIGASKKLYKSGDLVRWIDGNLEFIGRKDQQVKINGYRVEPDEVKCKIAANSAIREAVVVVDEGPSGRRLVAFYTTKEAITSEEIRRYLRSQLAEYMIPVLFIELEEIPRNVQGKTNQEVLQKELDHYRTTDVLFQAAKSKMEEKMVNEISKMFELDKSKVSISQNFFDLGINSIHIVKLKLSMSTDMGLDVPIVKFFEYPTIASLAKYCENQLANREEESEENKKIISKEDISHAEITTLFG